MRPPLTRTRGRNHPPLWLDLARALALAGAVLYLALGVRFAWESRLLNPNVYHTGDFRYFYLSAEAWHLGYDLYSGPNAVLPHANLNAPAFVLSLTPLALLPLRQALIVWWLINLVACATAIAIVLRELSLRLTWGAVLLGLVFAGTSAQLVLGQVAWLCMLPATLAWRDWRRQKPVYAGLWLGLLIGVKPLFFPVIGIALLRKQHRLLVAALATVLATVVVAGLACGWSAYGSWLRTGGGVYWYGLPLNASLRGVVARFAGEAMERPLWIGASLLVVGYTTWRLRRRGPDVERELAAAFLVCLLISPLGWVYYVPVALGPLIASLRRAEWRWWSIIGVAGLFWPPGIGWGTEGLPVERTIGQGILDSAYAIGLMVLWHLCLSSRAYEARAKQTAVGYNRDWDSEDVPAALA